MLKVTELPSWADYQDRLARVAQRRLFFVGGAPRSGTTWLQQILDAHPDICCKGEGLLWKTLAVPLETLMAERRKSLDEKNTTLFRHTGGYPLPGPADTEHLLGTAILTAFAQQAGDGDYRAIGEKTPENVFFFARLKQLFPDARFIAIARDPRDVLTSAWHFFRRPVAGEDSVAAMTGFIRAAMPSIADGARAMLDFHQRNPAESVVITYEDLLRSGPAVIAGIFRLLGVSDRADIVADCLDRASFAKATGGRAAGVEQQGAFHRKGIAGDWRSTLTPEMNAMLLRELGWMFPKFGWRE
jgi:hypothetical protein